MQRSFGVAGGSEALAADLSRGGSQCYPTSTAARRRARPNARATLTRDAAGAARARLLDLVPGRSGEAYRSWLHDRGPDFRDREEIATLDPFRQVSG